MSAATAGAGQQILNPTTGKVSRGSQWVEQARGVATGPAGASVGDLIENMHTPPARWAEMSRGERDQVVEEVISELVAHGALPTPGQRQTRDLFATAEEVFDRVKVDLNDARLRGIMPPQFATRAFTGLHSGNGGGRGIAIESDDATAEFWERSGGEGAHLDTYPMHVARRVVTQIAEGQSLSEYSTYVMPPRLTPGAAAEKGLERMRGKVAALDPATSHEDVLTAARAWMPIEVDGLWTSAQYAVIAHRLQLEDPDEVDAAGDAGEAHDLLLAKMIGVHSSHFGQVCRVEAARQRALRR